MAFGNVKFTLGFVGEDQISGIITKSQKGLKGLGTSAKKGSREARGAIGRMGSSVNSLTDDVARVGLAFTGIQSMATAAAGAVSAAFEFLERGDLASQIDRTFGDLVTNADAHLGKLREATRNLISDKEIKSNVIRMRLFGGGIEEITGTLAIASDVARLTGEDFQSMANRFSDAVATGSAESLKVYGINVDLAAAVEVAAQKTGQLVEEMSQQEIAAVRLDAVHTAFHGGLAAQGVAIDNTGKAIRSLATDFDSLIDTIAQGYSDKTREFFDLIGMEGYLTPIQKAAIEVDAAFESIFVEQGEYFDRTKELFTSVAKRGEGLGHIWEEQLAAMKGRSDAARQSVVDSKNLSIVERDVLNELLRAYVSGEIEKKDARLKFSALINIANERERAGQIKLNLSKKQAADLERELLTERKLALAESKKVLDWTNRLIDASSAARRAKGKSAASAAKARRAEAAGLAESNRITQMGIDGVDRLVIAKQKEADAVKKANEISTRSDSGRALRTEKIGQARLAYLKEWTAVQDAATKAKEDADKKAAKADDKRHASNAKIRDDLNKALQDAEVDRVDRLSASMLELGQHVEGAAMSVSSNSPRIAAAFGSIGAVVGITSDNLNTLGAILPKSLSAIGAITASTTQNVKTQATIQSAFEFAAGIAAGARLDFWGASQHALAGTMFAAVAGTAGGGKKSAGTSAGGGIGAGGLGSGGAGSALATSMSSSVTVNVQGLMSGTSADLGVALGESLSDVKTTGLGSRSV